MTAIALPLLIALLLLVRQNLFVILGCVTAFIHASE